MTTTLTRPAPGTAGAESTENAVLSGDARPFLRRDTFYSEIPGGVQFASTGPAFQLAGTGAFAIFERIAPFLNGETTRGELSQALGEQRWAHVETLLDHLADHGFLRWISDEDVALMADADRSAHADQIAFLAQYTDEPHRAFTRFRDRRLHIIGGGAIAASVAANLRANGHRQVQLADDPADYPTPEQLSAGCPVLVLPTAAGYAWFTAHRSELRPRDVLLVLGTADRLWVLPHSWAQNDGLLDWRDGLAALEAGGLVPGINRTFLAAEDGLDPLTGRAASTQVQRMLGAVLSYEIFKGLTGVLPAETSKGAICLDVVTGETTAHRVLAGTDRGRVSFRAPIAPAAARDELSADSSRADEYDAWSGLVEASTLPLHRFDDAELSQIPLKVGVVVTAAGDREVAASLWTLADARVEAIRRGYEDVVAALEPDQRDVELVEVGGDGRIHVDAAQILTRSRANNAGAWSRAVAPVGVAQDEPEAVARAVSKAVMEYLVRRHATSPGAVVAPLVPSSPTLRFIHDVAGTAHPLTTIDLGSVDGGDSRTHAAVAFHATATRPVWQVATGASYAEAAALAAAEVLAHLQLPEQAPGSPRDSGDITAAMRMWPDVDPRALVGADGTPAEHAVQIYAATLSAPLLTSAGIVAAAATVITREAT